MKLVKGLSLLVLLFVSALACAVDSFDYHCANIALMTDRPVQNDIGITQQQRDKMNQFARAHDARIKKYQASLGNRQPDMKVLQGYVDDLKRNVVGLMTPAQVKRLRELNLQAAGLLAILDKVVATKIGMNDAQYNSFRQAYISGKGSAEKLMQNAVLPISQKYQKLAAPYKGKEKEHQKELENLQKQFVAEVEAAKKRIQPQVDSITAQTGKKLKGMLTKSQNATWLALQGKKFVLTKGK